MPKRLACYGEELSGIAKHGPYYGVGDMDGDGRPDLIASTEVGSYRLLPPHGDGHGQAADGSVRRSARGLTLNRAGASAAPRGRASTAAAGVSFRRRGDESGARLSRADAQRHPAPAGHADGCLHLLAGSSVPRRAALSFESRPGVAAGDHRETLRQRPGRPR